MSLFALPIEPPAVLPSIRVSLPFLILLWAVVGVWWTESWVMLAYPAMWLGVAALFFVASKLLGSAAPADAG